MTGGLVTLCSSVTVNITVLDVNDNAPIFTQNTYSFFIIENMPLGTLLGVVSAANDADAGMNAQVQYTIFSEMFLINQNGSISTTSLLDYEQNTIFYSLMVQACDEGLEPLCSSVTVNVTVLDVNDNAPVFTQETYFMSIFENMAPGTFVGVVSANDADAGMNAQVQYIIVSGNIEGMFLIDSSTGIISTTFLLDSEQDTIFSH